MLDETETTTASPESSGSDDSSAETAPKATKKRAPAKKKAKAPAAAAAESDSPPGSTDDSTGEVKKKPRSGAKKPKAAAESDSSAAVSDSSPAAATAAAAPAIAMPLFKAPDASDAPPVRTRTRKPPVRRDADASAGDSPAGETSSTDGGSTSGDGDATEPKVTTRTRTNTRAKANTTADAQEPADNESQDSQSGDDDGEGGDGAARRRRRRGGRRRRKGGDGPDSDTNESENETEDTESDEGGGDGTSRRRRRRRRTGEDGGETADDPQNTVTRVRSRRSAEDEITAVAGSTRLEAKKQRRREGREAGRRRAPIVSEAEFLARRESVDRVMVVRQRGELTQIAVLEDKVLVEHYVARESQTSLIGNVYLGRVQNVLPSMEAAFVDIGKGRNAVLYAGEVNWTGLGHKDGQPRKIESFLSSGQAILVQVTKDPIGHKGARLTSQVSLAGRFLVYVPDGTTSGISRKLPDTERNRLKTLLKEIVPDTAGVIVRTAAEGASEDELTRDVEQLKARWEDIEVKAKGNAPALLYGEPDLTLKVVRDLFTEDFGKLVIEGPDAWDTVQGYVAHVAPDLEQRLERFEPTNGNDVFTAYRIDEQIAKGLDRKVWLPSGGSLVIDRTEAMTVVDVNTGKFTGSGGNLEETVTRNNLEAADEIVRQLRLRDIGGIIVVDFIDMVLESNRDLVLRRLAECLGRDRTRHQVAEVTSLGLVQMTRKRIGTGLLEAFSENCEHCQGRGVVVHDAPVPPRNGDDDRRGGGGGRRSRGGRSRGGDDSQNNGNGNRPSTPSPRDVAAVARPDSEPIVDSDADEPVVILEHIEIEPVVEPDPVVELDVEPEPVVVSDVEPEPVPEPDAGQTPHPVAEESLPTAEESQTVVAEVAAPAVVVRTRRRAASRPAGPPVETATMESPDGESDGSSESGGPDVPHFEHVPIKRKGARKR